MFQQKNAMSVAPYQHQLLAEAVATHNKFHTAWREAHEAGDFEAADKALMVAHDLYAVGFFLAVTMLGVGPQVAELIPEAKAAETEEEALEVVSRLDTDLQAMDLIRVMLGMDEPSDEVLDGELVEEEA